LLAGSFEGPRTLAIHQAFCLHTLPTGKAISQQSCRRFSCPERYTNHRGAGRFCSNH
jgi:hypothetical protein